MTLEPAPHVVARERARRSQRARAVAWILRRVLSGEPVAWVSTCAWIVVDGSLRRPPVCVSYCPPPLDGVVDDPPALVIHPTGRAERAADAWLAAGVGEVWLIGTSSVLVRGSALAVMRNAAGANRTVHREAVEDDTLLVPGSRALVRAADLLHPGRG